MRGTQSDIQLPPVNGEMAQPETRAAVSATQASPGVLRLVEGFRARIEEILDDAVGGRVRIRLFTNAQLTDAGGPAEAAPQHFLAFAAGNRRLDGAVIQRCQALSLERTQGLHTGHKGREQQGFYQTVVVAEGSLPGIIVRQTH